MGILFALFFLIYSSQTQSDETRALLPPNELGSVMVLMYHDIRRPESTWVRTPENFEKDLTVLFENNFRPVSLADFISHRVDIPTGTTPVVLTFDDATAGQFQVSRQNGEPTVTPTSAMGILERFHKEHPDFPLEATFFVNGRSPFKQPSEVHFKLNYIVSRGMDIGNHTTMHQNLRRAEMAAPEKIQSAIGGQAAFLESVLTLHPSYKIQSFALCFGQRPHASFLWKYLAVGIFKGKSYKNIAVLNVGASPAVSSLDKKFNPLSIPRIRASETGTAGVGLYDWLKLYEKHPKEKFISDGNPDSVTIPMRLQDKLDINRLSGQTLVTY